MTRKKGSGIVQNIMSAKIEALRQEAQQKDVEIGGQILDEVANTIADPNYQAIFSFTHEEFKRLGVSV